MIDIHDYDIQCIDMRFCGSTTNPHVIILTATACCPYERT